MQTPTGLSSHLNLMETQLVIYKDNDIDLEHNVRHM